MRVADRGRIAIPHHCGRSSNLSHRSDPVAHISRTMADCFRTVNRSGEGVITEVKTGIALDNTISRWTRGQFMQRTHDVEIPRASSNASCSRRSP